MIIYRNLSDDELAALLNEHDKNALEEIYLRYFNILYGYARRLEPDEFAAKDVVQDIFMSLLLQMGSLDFKTSLSFYLMRAVRNSMISQFRKEQHKNKYIASLKDFVDKGEYVTDNMVEERDTQAAIERELAALSPNLKEVFLMSRKENLTHKEIAEINNVTEGTVKKQVHNALKILRSKLSSFFFV